MNIAHLLRSRCERLTQEFEEMARQQHLPVAQHWGSKELRNGVRDLVKVIAQDRATQRTAPQQAAN